MKIFNSLLNQDSLADPIKQVQEILQKCFDMQDLQSEVRRGRRGEGGREEGEKGRRGEGGGEKGGGERRKTTMLEAIS